MALSPKGKQIKDLVLNNLEIYADAKIIQAKHKLENDFNSHATEQRGKNMQIGTSKEIRAKYKNALDELLEWKRYKEAIEELK